jgi:hypothetical protein
MNPFVVWEAQRLRNVAVLMDLEGFDRSHALPKGDPLALGFSSSATYRFDPDLKRNTLPADFYVNVDNALVCSERAKAYIESHLPAAVEHLPVCLLDHKRKPLPGAHFIIHPLDHPDCIDPARSRATWSKIDPTVIQFAQHIEVDASRVPPERLLFRPRSFPDLLLMRREFAEAIVSQGFVGAGWSEIE